MERCATCRHWQPPQQARNYGIVLPEEWAVCERMSPADFDPYSGRLQPQEGSRAVAGGLDDIVLELYTAPDFGCVLWAAKEA